MFVVATNPTFNHTVKVLVPVDGGHEEQTFKTTFRVLPSDRESAFDLQTVDGSNDFLRAIVVDMSELEDGNGGTVAYNDRVRDQLLALPFIRTALTKTYFAAIGKATEGN
jgi:hypothetical protein